jgi:hypothetical protein
MRLTKFSTPLAAWAMTGLLALAVAGCGDKPQAPAAAAQPAAAKPAASGPVSESEHERFEKKYMEMCVKGQQGNPDSPIKSDQQLGPVCECIAKTISKRLSKAEAVHFLDKKEIPIDIVMMGNAASDICAQAAK